MPTRKYEQGLRAEAAEETRKRILDALYARLSEQPSEPVSVEQVARLARVARSTIYLVFGSRAGLFDALAAELFRTGEFARVAAAAANPDAREHLRGGIRGATEMMAAHRDVFRVLYSMAQLDEHAVGGAVHRLEDARARGMARMAERLGDQGLLRDGVTVADATSLIWMYGSFDAFDVLYTGRGLSVDEIVELFTTTLERALYP